MAIHSQIESSLLNAVIDGQSHSSAVKLVFPDRYRAELSNAALSILI
jgi:hypothetical protein